MEWIRWRKFCCQSWRNRDPCLPAHVRNLGSKLSEFMLRRMNTRPSLQSRRSVFSRKGKRPIDAYLDIEDIILHGEKGRCRRNPSWIRLFIRKSGICSTLWRRRFDFHRTIHPSFRYFFGDKIKAKQQRSRQGFNRFLALTVQLYRSMTFLALQTNMIIQSWSKQPLGRWARHAKCSWWKRSKRRLRTAKSEAKAAFGSDEVTLKIH